MRRFWRFPPCLLLPSWGRKRDNFRRTRTAGSWRSIRKMRPFLALTTLLGLQLLGSAARAQTEARPDAAKKPTVTAQKLLAAAYEKTKDARSVDDFSEVIEHC